MTKMGQKLIKIAQKSRCFVHFLYLFSENFRAPVPHSWRRQWTGS